MLTKQILPVRAKKDIVCYKVLEKEKDFGYRTPYYKMVCHIGTTVQALPLTTKLPIKSLRGNNNVICEGFIHAFMFLEEAVFLKCNLRMEQGGDFVVVKCIIPKGTLYYKGLNNGRNLQEICAKTMKLLEVVT